MTTGEASTIVVPRENVNDESATLVAWLVGDGASVERGTIVAQIETSKAVVDLEAPASGILHHVARAGQDVPIGGEIGRVGGSGEAAPAASASSTASSTPAGHANGSSSLPLAPSVRRLVAQGNVDPAQVKGTGRGGRITKGDVVDFLAASEAGSEPEPLPPPRSTRFSPQARALLGQLGLDEAQFAGRGLIRARDLLPPEPSAPVAPTVAPVAASPSRPVAASGVAVRSEPLSRAKKTEGKYLRSGFESTLASVVTVACPTRGFRQALGADASSLILLETARLLRKYPAFNAYHEEGVAHYYEDVNVGFAVDAGKGLKVPVVRGADRLGLDAVATTMRDLVVSYLNDALPVEALSGGTFTITDLSGEGVTTFHPLINRGQAAILGVGAEAMGVFHLILAFDHQLAEGRTAARFLGDLRDRLAAHEASSLGSNAASAAVVEEPRCSRCQAGFRELASDGHVLVQTVRLDGSSRLLCKLCLEGWN
jgi:pyruvate/2-oxoglutarate dehydrogenase complex dihydrolipoamide acyltransferase (E2) component